MSAKVQSLRLDWQDQARLAELSAMLGTNPSSALRALLRAAVPTPSARFVGQTADDLEAAPDLEGDDDDDPAERDTLPPPPASMDPRQLTLGERFSS